MDTATLDARIAEGELLTRQARRELAIGRWVPLIQQATLWATVIATSAATIAIRTAG